MSIPFDGSRGLIVVHAEVSGPSGSGVFRLALDTGATGTVVGSHLLTALGYDLKAATERVEVTTGSGVESVVRIAVSQLTALGLTQTSFPSSL